MPPLHRNTGQSIFCRILFQCSSIIILPQILFCLQIYNPFPRHHSYSFPFFFSTFQQHLQKQKKMQHDLNSCCMSHTKTHSTGYMLPSILSTYIHIFLIWRKVSYLRGFGGEGLNWEYLCTILLYLSHWSPTLRFMYYGEHHF